jgi:CheY-like chemotaxis protein
MVIIDSCMREATANLRILVVEDHADAAHLMCQILRRPSREIRSAGSVRAALAEAGRWTPDVVISDLSLPDGNGFDLMRALKARAMPPAGIALSGHVSDADIALCRLAGFDRHIAKPFDTQELSFAIDELAPSRAEQRI